MMKAAKYIFVTYHTQQYNQC